MMLQDDKIRDVKLDVAIRDRRGQAVQRARTAADRKRCAAIRDRRNQVVERDRITAFRHPGSV